jgi:hypothetical protein
VVAFLFRRHSRQQWFSVDHETRSAATFQSRSILKFKSIKRESFMRTVTRVASRILITALTAIGCGGKSGSMITPMPISVSLAPSSVVVSQDGTPASVQISITSTSETALVSVNVLPAGVRETYFASDTNPSGILTFVAGTSTAVGTYPLTVNVNSAGQFASTQFTLTVKAAASGS